MKVGINYPWLRCGWDFGTPPAGYGTRAGHFETIAADLTALADSGVQIVRWFVLADGFVVGTGAEAPARGRSGFRFDVRAPLEQRFLDDFERLLVLCTERGLQLLPVLLDFHWAFPGLDRHTRDAPTLQLWDRTPRTIPHPLRLQQARERAARLPAGYVKGGRRDVLTRPEVGARFFEHVLAPLLRVSQRQASAIYAWELLNEPEWITARVPGESLVSWRIGFADLQRFLRAGSTLIRGHGFAATVGFARGRSIGRFDVLGLDLNQLHYYPRSLLHSLPAPRFANGLPCVLGELASAARSPHPWPDLPSTHQDVTARLSLARDLGYAAALPWSYRATDRATQPDRDVLLAALARFTR